MNDEHIINLLDEEKFRDLSGAEIRSIEDHARSCADCAREYEAAKVAALVLRERAAQTIEPTPFFETRVLAAWREKQAALQPVVNRLRQWWQDTKILVSGLATAVMLLMVLTFIAPQVSNNAPLQASAIDYYSVESLVFERPEPSVDLTDAQLLEEIYGSDELEN